MLGTLTDVLLSVNDAEAAAKSYCKDLQYSYSTSRIVEASDPLAMFAPQIVGKTIYQVKPTEDDTTSLSFITSEGANFNCTFHERGWNAIEIVVNDVDQLIEDLRDTSFTVTTGKLTVDKFPYLTAVNAKGPSGEAINFTRVYPYKDDLPFTDRRAGKVFIVTLAVKDLQETIEFYRHHLDADVSDIKEVALGNLNRTLGLPADTRHPLITIRLRERTKLEIDEAPSVCVDRKLNAIGLPGGVSCVTMKCDDIEKLQASLEAAGEKFFRSANKLLVVGKSGELITFEG